MAHPKESKPITPRKGRVGNFLVQEEIIEREDSEPLSRLHISDVEHGWEVIIPQNYGSAYHILEMAFGDETGNLSDKTAEILAWVIDNFFLVTTCMDGEFHTLIRDIALLGFTPAVNKQAVKTRKEARKYISDRLRTFEFPDYSQQMTPEEERQAEIAQDAQDILEEKG